ncbi:MAG: sensor domain-containing diguanylate cyclase [Acidimicrobiales bacterium]
MELSAHDHLTLLSSLPDAVAIISLGGDILWSNGVSLEIFGHHPEAWVGRNILDLVHPHDAELAISAVGTMNDRGDNGRGILMTVQLRHADGRWIKSEARGRRITIDGEQVIALVVRDIEDRYRLDLAHGNVDLLKTMVHHSESLLMHLDDEFRITTASPALTRLLGYDGFLSEGRSLLDMVDEVDRETTTRILNQIAASAVFEANFRHQDGSMLRLHSTVHDLRADATVQGYVLTATDITDLRRVQSALRQMAETDSLTGLLNRAALIERMQDRFASKQPQSLAVIFADLDGFKTVNDTYGHGVGDLVLQEVAARLQRCVHTDDFLARIGGDEFVIVLTEPGIVGPKAVGDRIRAALATPFVPAGQLVNVGVSLGNASAEDYPTVSALLAAADKAMYEAKRAQRAQKRTSA